MKRTIAFFALTALMAGALAARGQNYSSKVSLPNVSGITVYNGAPEGFDPVSAADSQLEDYGYPRRPDPGDTKAYANWVKAVSTTRITPQLSITTDVRAIGFLGTSVQHHELGPIALAVIKRSLPDGGALQVAGQNVAVEPDPSGLTDARPRA